MNNDFYANCQDFIKRLPSIASLRTYISLQRSFPKIQNGRIFEQFANGPSKYSSAFFLIVGIVSAFVLWSSFSNFQHAMNLSNCKQNCQNFHFSRCSVSGLCCWIYFSTRCWKQRISIGSVFLACRNSSLVTLVSCC